MYKWVTQGGATEHTNPSNLKQPLTVIHVGTTSRWPRKHAICFFPWRATTEAYDKTSKGNNNDKKHFMGTTRRTLRGRRGQTTARHTDFAPLLGRKTRGRSHETTGLRPKVNKVFIRPREFTRTMHFLEGKEGCAFPLNPTTKIKIGISLRAAPRGDVKSNESGATTSTK